MSSSLLIKWQKWIKINPVKSKVAEGVQQSSQSVTEEQKGPTSVVVEIVPSSVSVAEQLQSSMESIVVQDPGQRSPNAQVNQTDNLSSAVKDAPRVNVHDAYATQDFVSRRVLSHGSEAKVDGINKNQESQQGDGKAESGQPGVQGQGHSSEGASAGEQSQNIPPEEGSTLAPPTNDVPAPPTEAKDEDTVTTATTEEPVVTVTAGSYDTGGQWSRKINDEELGRKEDEAYKAEQPWNKISALCENQIKLIIQKVRVY